MNSMKSNYELAENIISWKKNNHIFRFIDWDLFKTEEIINGIAYKFRQDVNAMKDYCKMLADEDYVEIDDNTEDLMTKIIGEVAENLGYKWNDKECGYVK